MIFLESENLLFSQILQGSSNRVCDAPHHVNPFERRGLLVSVDQGLICHPSKFFQIDRGKEGEGKIRKGMLFYLSGKNGGPCTSLLRNIYLQTFLFNKDLHTQCSKIVVIIIDL